MPALSPTLRVLIGLAAAVIALAGLYFARELVGPLVLGAVMVIICHPVRHPLERRGWPRWAATTAVIVVAYLILAGPRRCCCSSPASSSRGSSATTR